MPTRRDHDTNEERWNNLILPLVPKGTTFLELGCNAGFYLRKAVDLGFKATGIEKSRKYFRHAVYWETNDPKGVKLIRADLNSYNFSASSVVLLANVHYWLTPLELGSIVSKLSRKALYCIVVGRHRKLPTHKSPCDINSIKKSFVGWIEGKSIKGKKHYSIIFKNPDIEEVDTGILFRCEQSEKRKRLISAFQKMIVGDNKEYIEYLKWRGFKGIRGWLRRRNKLIRSVKKHGIINPLNIYETRIIDGNHRLILAHTLGLKTVLRTTLLG